MKFVDEVVIHTKGGNGGDGMCHFARTRHQPKGGPDGGDGGKGGDVVVVADKRKLTLLDFKYKKHFVAENGGKGGTNNKTGKKGKNVYLYVPLGTKIIDLETKEVIADLVEDGSFYVVAKGGAGGLGNSRFASARNRMPLKFTRGKPGEEKKVMLSLEVIAHVGLVGLPNAGKSSLLSVISRAKPRIAEYPFTTLAPELGIVTFKDISFVVADLPGLIQGASSGKGLGFKFLKHLSRVRIICHLVDITLIQSPAGLDFSPIKLIEDEISMFSKDIFNKPKILVFTKIDLCEPKKQELELEGRKMGYLDVCFLSSITKIGVDDFLSKITKHLNLNS